MKGRKRHILGDTQGMVLKALPAHSAKAMDYEGIKTLLGDAEQSIPAPLRCMALGCRLARRGGLDPGRTDRSEFRMQKSDEGSQRRARTNTTLYTPVQGGGLCGWSTPRRVKTHRPDSQ